MKPDPVTPNEFDDKYHMATSSAILRWFESDHLSPSLQETSRQFERLARSLEFAIQPGPERTIALRKLL